VSETPHGLLALACLVCLLSAPPCQLTRETTDTQAWWPAVTATLPERAAHACRRAPYEAMVEEDGVDTSVVEPCYLIRMHSPPSPIAACVC
jgi:hypothetical protein